MHAKMMIALTATTLLAPLATSAQAQGKSETLTLYAKQNQGGEKRVIKGNETDLKTLKADNFAFSLKAEGRWEVCMDPGFRAGCKIVEGVVADLGGDGGTISSARYVGPAGAASAPAAKGTAAQPAAEQAYVYSTLIYSHIKPNLIMNSFDAKTGGRWIATQTEDELNYIYNNYGRYGVTTGSFEGEFSGDTFTGHYSEDFWNDGLQGACAVKVGGTFYYGTVVIKFSADRSSFKAKKVPCDGDPADTDYEWEGTLTGRTAPVAVKASAAASGSQAGKDKSKPETAADRVARDAGDEVERSVSDGVRKKVRKGIGSLFGVE